MTGLGFHRIINTSWEILNLESKQNQSMPKAYYPKITESHLATIKTVPACGFPIARQRHSKVPLICITPDLTNELLPV